MTVENTFAVNWVLALKQVTIWTAERRVLLQGDPIRERAQRVCSIAALSAATIVMHQFPKS
jgi:hypothetical protein